MVVKILKIFKNILNLWMMRDFAGLERVDSRARKECEVAGIDAPMNRHLYGPIQGLHITISVW